MEDKNHMFTCWGPSVIKNRENLTELKQELEVLETAPTLTKEIIGGLRNVHKDTTLSPYSFGTGSFERGITISRIIRDQEDIG